MKKYFPPISKPFILIARLVFIIFFCAIGVTNVHAAITFDSSSSVVSGTTTATTVSWSHTVGAGSNRILIVGVSIVDTSENSVSSINYGGSALTRIGTRNRNAGGYYYYTEMWYLLSPANGTNTITVNISNSASIAAGAASFAGVNLSSPLGTFVSANANNSAPTVNATTVAGDMVIDTLTTIGNSTITTVGANQTIRWNPAPGGGAGWARGSGSTELATGGTTTMSWSGSSSSNWTIGAVPIHAALPAPTVTKSFSAVTMPVNGAANMTITLTNPNTTLIGYVSRQYAKYRRHSFDKHLRRNGDYAKRRQFT
jgi:hypothetical protein